MKRDFCSLFWGLIFVLVSCVALGKGVPVGTQVEQLTFKDIRYLPRTLSDLGEAKAYVIVFTTTGCPLVQRYLPRLKEMAAEYREQGVQFLAMNVGANDSIQDMAYQALEYGADFPFVKDIENECAKTLGATRTPEVVILDSERRIRYRGRVDNQYRLSGIKPQADREDLREAILDLLANRAVKTKNTPVDGCAISFGGSSAKASLTYARDIAPLINKQCVVCHRPGTEAPFALTSYEKVAARASSIAEVVEDRRMPPWFAHEHFGKFTNERKLTDEERDKIVHWARGGKLAGDLSKAPRPPEFASTKWQIGEPDLVIRAGQVEKLAAVGYIPYRYVMLPYVFPHDTWVQGVEIMPSNPRVVHHANLAFASLTQGFDVDRNFITGKVPGGIPVDLGSGVAVLIPKGSVLALQIHYVTTGKEEEDQISVGLRFAREPVRKRLKYKIIADYKFRIPPGAPAHPVSAQKQLECDATGIGLFSHMHLRGKDSSFFAHYPDGKDETLLVLPNYNFDWQLSYTWERGTRHFPKGTKIECISHFDNSAFNPYNPDPKATVKNGLQTHQEMMQGFFFYTDDSENLNIRVDPKTGEPIAEQKKAAAGN
jgi:thiol-disulfide isomerase/thioredoxin